MAEEEARPYKRRRVGATDGSEAVTSPQPGTDEVEQEPIRHLLYVRWFGGQGQTKLNKLPLKQIDTLEALEDLPKELVDSHYPSTDQLPDYFTNTAYIRFTPEVDCLALPGDVVRTELRLVLCYGGWEYTILKRDTTHNDPGPEQTIRVMTAEFMGSDPLMAALGLRISLIAYPVVALSKRFLDEVHERLMAAPDDFKGML